MKIFGAAVVVVSCMPYAAAFIGPQVTHRQVSKINLQSNGDSPSWVGAAATVVAGLTVASQMAGASVDVASPSATAIVQNGEDFIDCLVVLPKRSGTHLTSYFVS